MGKGPKPLKIKTYKVPTDSKFMVIINPWGYAPDAMKYTFNNISAWLEVMLRVAHPNTRPDTIYYQKTHRNVIVELPGEVDLAPYLGSHRYRDFLTLEYVDPSQVAYMYEYNYRQFNHPERTNWSSGSPEYRSVPDNIPIRTPYPQAGYEPMPPKHIPYALPMAPLPNPPVPAPAPPALGPDIDFAVEALLAEAQAQAHGGREAGTSGHSGMSSMYTSAAASRNVSEMPNGPKEEEEEQDIDRSPTPTPTPQPPKQEDEQGQGVFRPYEPPSHYHRPSPPPPSRSPSRMSTSTLSSVASSKSKMTKWDPYEEEEEAERLLRAFTPSESMEVEMPPEPEVEDVKPFIKPEPEEDVKPLMVKQEEPMFTDDVRERLRLEAYHPSSSRGSSTIDRSSTTPARPASSSEPHDRHGVIKREASPPPTPTISGRSESSSSMTMDTPSATSMGVDDDDYTPSAELAAAFADFADIGLLTGQGPDTAMDVVKVKPEPHDHDASLLNSNAIRVKPEPMDEISLGPQNVKREGSSRSMTLGRHASTSTASTRSSALPPTASPSPSPATTDTMRTPSSGFSVKAEPVEAIIPRGPPPATFRTSTQILPSRSPSATMSLSSSPAPPRHGGGPSTSRLGPQKGQASSFASSVSVKRERVDDSTFLADARRVEARREGSGAFGSRSIAASAVNGRDQSIPSSGRERAPSAFLSSARPPVVTGKRPSSTLEDSSSRQSRSCPSTLDVERRKPVSGLAGMKFKKIRREEG